MGIRSTVRRAVESVLIASGADRAVSRLRPKPGAVVLMYHSVSDSADRAWIDPANDMPAEVFTRHVEFLAKERRVISMSSLADAAARGRDLEPGSVVLTFDDGYLNNFRVAAPLLKWHGLPATLYLPTKYIDDARTQWVDRLFVMVRDRTRSAVTMEDGSSVDVSRGVGVLRAALRAASDEKRAVFLARWEGQLKPAASRRPRLTMNWDDVRALVRQYPTWEIGGHTAGHRDLTSCLPAEAAMEIAECARTIERELGVRPRHFSFPYGRSNDTARGLVNAGGWASAVAARGGRDVRSGRDPWWIPRVEAPDSLDTLRFRTSAGYPGLVQWAMPRG